MRVEVDEKKTAVNQTNKPEKEKEIMELKAKELFQVQSELRSNRYQTTGEKKEHSE